MTTTQAGRTAEPMTKLNDEKTERRPRFLRAFAPEMPKPATAGEAGEQDGKPVGRAPATTAAAEIWYAESADGRWAYNRTETPTTPWLVTYLPTGQESLFSTLAEARRWTARDAGRAALAFLRAEAYRVIERCGESGAFPMFNPGTPESVRAEARARAAEHAAERVGIARRSVFVLEGAVLADEPVTRCTGGGLLGACSGYLVEVLAGDGRSSWVHADTCRECIDETPAKRRECHQLHRHLSCGDPDPVLCHHGRCSAPTVVLDGGQCEHGREACCGCCGCE